ncbi:MAG: N-6 DNA methylase [Saprospiraceae bacterium]|nr:N-6 DNA methylase [Saprospiraceae bacterium]
MNQISSLTVREQLGKILTNLSRQYKRNVTDEHSLYLTILGLIWLAQNYNSNKPFRDFIESSLQPDLDTAISFLLPAKTELSTCVKKHLKNYLIEQAQVNLLSILFISTELEKIEYDQNDLFEILLAWLNSDSIGFQRQYGYGGNSQLSELLSRLVKIENGNTIIDPAAGTGSLLQKLDLAPAEKIKLIDIDEQVSVMTYLLWSFHKEFNKIEILTMDSISNMKEWTNKVDILVCEPPLGKRKSDTWQSQLITRTNDLTEQFVWFAIYALSAKGRAYIIVPDGLLFSEQKSTKELRSKLISSDLIEYIISFPTGFYAPYTSIKTNLLVLSKDKKSHLRGRFALIESSQISNLSKEPGKINLEELQEIIDGNIYQSESILKGGKISYNSTDESTSVMSKNYCRIQSF